MTTSPSMVNQGAQYGVETQRGTAVTADTDFRSVMVKFSPVVETEKTRSSGERFASAVYKSKEYSTGDLTGTPCWEELPGLFSWTAGTPTVTDNGDGTETSEWIIAGEGETRTVMYGSKQNPSAGARLTGCFVKSIDMSFGRSSGESSVNASLHGGVFEDNVTLDTVVNSAEVDPITAEMVSVYMDGSLANIGSTLVSDALSVGFSTGDIRSEVWTLDASKSSFSDVTDVALESTVDIKVKANAFGRGLLDDLRNGAKKYLRIEALKGDKVLHIDFCVSAENHDRADEDAVYAVSATLAVIQDASGFSHKVSITKPNA